MEPRFPQGRNDNAKGTETSRKIAPAFEGDEDWDYPPEIKQLISLLAKQAATDYFNKHYNKKGNRSE